MFHQAVADRVGLHVTDLRCLNLLAQAGPLTAGELGQQLGLGTTGAVTRMVDRLEGAGYVRREADPRDRGRVIIRPVPERLATIAPHYQGMVSAWTDLLAGYSDEQLHLFLDLFDRMHQMSPATTRQPAPRDAQHRRRQLMTNLAVGKPRPVAGEQEPAKEAGANNSPGEISLGTVAVGGGNRFLSPGLDTGSSRVSEADFRRCRHGPNWHPQAQSRAPGGAGSGSAHVVRGALT